MSEHQKTIDRLNATTKMLKDPELDATPKEVVIFVARLFRAEYLRLRAVRIKNKANKHYTWLNDTYDVFEFRKQINSLKIL